MKYSISLTEVSATDPKADWNWYVRLDGKTLAQGREIVRGCCRNGCRHEMPKSPVRFERCG